MSILSDIRRRFMLTCKDVNQFLVDYVDGNLEPGTEERFQNHVSRCPQCTEFIDQYRLTIEEVRRSAKDELPRIPEEVVEYTLAFLRQHYDEEKESGSDCKG